MSSVPPAGHPTPSEFSAELAVFDAGVENLMTKVSGAIRQATAALVYGDQAEAEKVTKGIQLSPSMLATLEQKLDFIFARQAPRGADLRLMISVLRVLPILERAVELTRHIADRTPFAEHFPADVLNSYKEMGAVAASMWDKTSEAWQKRDSALAGQLDRDDDAMDSLAAGVTRRIGEMTDSPIVGMEGGLLVRFYERIADYAVDVGGRIVYLATGTESARN